MKEFSKFLTLHQLQNTHLTSLKISKHFAPIYSGITETLSRTYDVIILQFRIFNPSTAKGGRVKITTQSTFLPNTQTTRPATKIPFVTSLNMFSIRNGVSLDFL